MKKFIFILSILAMSGLSYGQVVVSNGPINANYLGAYTTTTKTYDTLTNMADTSYFAIKTIDSKNSYESGSLQIIAKRISGTCVVTLYLEKSNDNINWFQTTTADTFNLKPAANATKSGGFIIPSSTQTTGMNFIYYRIRAIGHNTAAVQLKGIYYLRKD